MAQHYRSRRFSLSKRLTARTKQSSVMASPQMILQSYVHLFHTFERAVKRMGGFPRSSRTLCPCYRAAIRHLMGILLNVLANTSSLSSMESFLCSIARIRCYRPMYSPDMLLSKFLVIGPWPSWPASRLRLPPSWLHYVPWSAGCAYLDPGCLAGVTEELSSTINGGLAVLSLSNSWRRRRCHVVVVVFGLRKSQRVQRMWCPTAKLFPRAGQSVVLVEVVVGLVDCFSEVLQDGHKGCRDSNILSELESLTTTATRAFIPSYSILSTLTGTEGATTPQPIEETAVQAPLVRNRVQMIVEGEIKIVGIT